MTLNYKVYRDDDFNSGDSPIIIDIETDLGKNSPIAIINDGIGGIFFEIEFNSNDGFGDKVKAIAGVGTIVRKDVKRIRISLEDISEPSGYSIIAALDIDIDLFGNRALNSIIDDVTIIPNYTTSTTLSSAITLNTSTSIKLADSKSNRKFFSLSNKSNADIWIKLQLTSTDNDKKGILIPSCSYWEMPQTSIYMGEISGIADDQSGDVYITEY